MVVPRGASRAGGGWSLHWVPVSETSPAEDLSLLVLGGSDEGWYGVGFSSSGQMVGSDSVEAWQQGDVCNTEAYKLGGSTVGSVKPMDLGLTNPSFERRDGRTLMKFRRPFGSGSVPVHMAE